MNWIVWYVVEIFSTTVAQSSDFSAVISFFLFKILTIWHDFSPMFISYKQCFLCKIFLYNCCIFLYTLSSWINICPRIKYKCPQNNFEIYIRPSQAIWIYIILQFIVPEMDMRPWRKNVCFKHKIHCLYKICCYIIQYIQLLVYCMHSVKCGTFFPIDFIKTAHFFSQKNAVQSHYFVL